MLSIDSINIFTKTKLLFDDYLMGAIFIGLKKTETLSTKAQCDARGQTKMFGD